MPILCPLQTPSVGAGLDHGVDLVPKNGGEGPLKIHVSECVCGFPGFQKFLERRIRGKIRLVPLDISEYFCLVFLC